MDIRDAKGTAATLHRLERKVLSEIGRHHRAEAIAKAAGLTEAQALRALQWLASKGIVRIDEDSREIAELGRNGRTYREKGLPERRFLDSLKKGPLTAQQIRQRAGLDSNEFGAAAGVLRRLEAIRIGNEIALTAEGDELVHRKLPQELLLAQEFPVELAQLTDSEKELLQGLRSRGGIIEIAKAKSRTAQLTRFGEEVAKLSQEDKAVDRITVELLRTGWKGVRFRPYDVTAPVPRAFAGRKQPYRRFLDEIKQKFIALGFKEMSGPIVETEFWNMDALFMPQFHSARDIHQGYSLKEPSYAKNLPKRLVDNVKKAHEDGFGTGSKGWRYTFDIKRTHRFILRTHDTAISPRTLASSSLEIPGKYFQMVRCFRYDVIDATHLSDFSQIGGFVIEDGINFRHLIGLLKLFAKEFAETEEVKVVPAYFPFTEPSAALYAKHPEMGWIELGGSGIFRPEMTHPLGVKTPVIAWGIGVERLAMFKLGIKDIRQLFSHDMEFLRSAKLV